MSFGPIYLDHIGIAAHQLDDNSSFWSLIGLVQGREDETVEDQVSRLVSSQQRSRTHLHLFQKSNS